MDSDSNDALNQHRQDRINLLEEDVGLSEATLATLTSQLTSLDDHIAAERATLLERKAQLHILQGQRATLFQGVQENEGLLRTAESTFRKCLEAYKKKMSELMLSMEIEESSAPEQSESQGRGKVNIIKVDQIEADAFSQVHNGPVRSLGADLCLRESAEELGVASDVNHASPECECSKNNNAHCEIDGIPPLIELPCREWAGPNAILYMCTDSGQLQYYCPRGKHISVSTERRCWTGTLSPPIENADVMRSIIAIERAELNDKLKKQGYQTEEFGTVASSCDEMSIRRNAAHGTCLDPVAICFHWYSPGKRRLLPWEHDDAEDKNSLKAAVDQPAVQSKAIASWFQYGAIPLRNEGVMEPVSPEKEVSVDPNIVICPYQLMGECQDSACPFQHVGCDKKSTIAKEQSNKFDVANTRITNSDIACFSRCLPLPDLRLSVPTMSISINNGSCDQSKEAKKPLWNKLGREYPSQGTKISGPRTDRANKDCQTDFSPSECKLNVTDLDKNEHDFLAVPRLSPTSTPNEASEGSDESVVCSEKSESIEASNHRTYAPCGSKLCLCAIPWWWCESLSCEKAKGAWTGDPYRLPLPDLLCFFGFTVSNCDKKHASSIPTCIGIGPSWRFLLSNMDWSSSAFREQCLKACITFIAAVLDCVRLLAAAGRTNLGVIFMRTCRRWLKVVGLKSKEGTESLVLHAVDAIESLLKTAMGLSGFETFEVQTKLLMLSEWLYALFKADHHILHAHSAYWLFLLSRCIESRSEHSLFSAIRKTNCSGGMNVALQLAFTEAQNLAATTARDANTDVVELNLLLWSMSLGYALAASLSSHVKTRSINNVVDYLLDPLWVEAEKFIFEEVPCPLGGLVIPRDVRCLCCLLIVAPSFFLAVCETIVAFEEDDLNPLVRAILTQQDELIHRALVTFQNASKRNESSIHRNLSREEWSRSGIKSHYNISGLVIAPLYALSASISISLGQHGIAQHRIEKAIVCDRGWCAGGISQGLVYSELIWSQLLCLRSYFSALDSGEAAAMQSEKIITKLSNLALEFGVLPFHVTMTGDAALIRNSCFVATCLSADEIFDKARNTARNKARQVCYRIYQWQRCDTGSRTLQRGNVGASGQGAKVTLSLKNGSNNLNLPSLKECGVVKAKPQGVFPLRPILLGDRIAILIVQDCCLVRIPEIIGFYMRGLRVLDVSKNQLVGLPNSIRLMAQLTYLNLSENALKNLPDTIGELRNLTKLDFSQNEVKLIPPSICACQQLQVIKGNRNKLESVPADLSLKLKHLHTLDLNFVIEATK